MMSIAMGFVGLPSSTGISVMHRFLWAPDDYNVIPTAYDVFQGYGSDQFSITLTESTMTAAGIAIALSLVSRYVSVVAYLAVSLPGSPWVANSQGKLIYAGISAFVSAAKEEGKKPRVAFLRFVLCRNPILIVALVIAGVSYSDEGRSSLSQATFESLVNRTAGTKRQTWAVRKDGSTAEALQEFAADGAKAASVADSLEAVAFDSAAQRLALKTLMKTQKLPPAQVPHAELLAATQVPLTVVHGSGIGFGHAAKLPDGSILTCHHALVGPNSELGELGPNETLHLITAWADITVQMSRSIKVEKVGATNLLDAVVYFGHGRFSTFPEKMPQTANVVGWGSHLASGMATKLGRDGAECAFFKGEGLSRCYTKGNSGGPGYFPHADEGWCVHLSRSGRDSLIGVLKGGAEPHGDIITVEEEHSPLLRYLHGKLCLKEPSIAESLFAGLPPSVSVDGVSSITRLASAFKGVADDDDLGQLFVAGESR